MATKKQKSHASTGSEKSFAARRTVNPSVPREQRKPSSQQKHPFQLQGPKRRLGNYARGGNAHMSE